MKFKALFLAIFLSGGLPAGTPDALAKAVYGDSILSICDYYTRQGDRRYPNQIRPFMDSAIRVSRMIGGFPTEDPTTNAHAYVAWGAQEVGLKRNKVYINIPGDSYASVGAVRFFSLDYGWTGINSLNVRWTATTAICLQTGQEFPQWIRQQIQPQALAFMRANIRIPKKLKLKKIDPRWHGQVEYEWYRAQFFMNREKFKKTAVIPYREDTMDDLDSLLIYRVLTEIDRKYRKWPYKTWNKAIYARLGVVRGRHQER